MSDIYIQITPPNLTSGSLNGQIPANSDSKTAESEALTLSIHLHRRTLSSLNAQIPAKSDYKPAKSEALTSSIHPHRRNLPSCSLNESTPLAKVTNKESRPAFTRRPSRITQLPLCCAQPHGYREEGERSNLDRRAEWGRRSGNVGHNQPRPKSQAEYNHGGVHEDVDQVEFSSLSRQSLRDTADTE